MDREGEADSSCLSVSMETDCIKQTLNGQTELPPLRRVRGREDITFQQLELGAPCSSRTDDKGPICPHLALTSWVAVSARWDKAELEVLEIVNFFFFLSLDGPQEAAG